MKYLAKRENSKILIAISVMVIILVSSNLRSPISAVGPVLNQIVNSLNLEHFQSSLLTSIPLFMFASCSLLVSRFAQNLSITRFLLFALLILSFGLFIRISGNVAALFVGSLILGLGIAICNVLLPGYIKLNFPEKIGLMTGIFAVSINLTAALASAYSLSLGDWTGYGWRGSLGIWLVTAILALIIVVIDLIFNKKKNKHKMSDDSKTDFNMFKSKQAWNIALFLGLQSLVYYCIVSWLPSVLIDYGMTGNNPGWVLFAIQFAAIPITFVGPIIANKLKDQKIIIVFICVTMMLSILMFVWLKTDLVYLTAILLGFSNGLAFSLSILFFSLRTKTSANALKISGMAQSVGYLIAASGPPVFGKLHDFDPSWKWSFYFLVAIIIMTFIFGYRAADKRFVED
ncbi:CynX/NimT family MFS transporter [Sphingobacterium sp. HSC-15S19]|uniref:CynX/NimT family MFS transporter n=1 Tax=Sphingobacterium TaxID=28453 RepID=UPI003D1AA0FC